MPGLVQCRFPSPRRQNIPAGGRQLRISAGGKGGTNRKRQKTDPQAETKPETLRAATNQKSATLTSLSGPSIQNWQSAVLLAICIRRFSHIPCSIDRQSESRHPQSLTPSSSRSKPAWRRPFYSCSSSFCASAQTASSGYLLPEWWCRCLWRSAGGGCR